jgi:hypothetical protein
VGLEFFLSHILVIKSRFSTVIVDIYIDVDRLQDVSHRCRREIWKHQVTVHSLKQNMDLFEHRFTVC